LFGSKVYPLFPQPSSASLSLFPSVQVRSIRFDAPAVGLFTLQTHRHRGFAIAGPAGFFYPARLSAESFGAANERA
jgi:hypothetical protein